MDDITEQEIAIIEQIMTDHWDMVVCPCWICQAGYANGCRPREIYARHRKNKDGVKDG